MSAKEMFEQLGYNYYEDDGFACYEKKNHKSIEPTYISFNRLGEDVYMQRKEDGIAVDVPLLKAIIQQVKDLGWLDEKK